ncbi:hypothetical protein BsWGS_22970 [Bradybaena similaris]
MTSWTSVSLLFLVWTALLGTARTQDLRQNFLDLISGVFNDQHQLQAGFTDRDVMEFNISRVSVPVLGKEVQTLYMLERVKGRLYRRTVLAVPPAKDKQLNVQLYNISESTHPSSVELSPADLQTLTLDDLDTRPECKAVFNYVADQVYSGNVVDCRHSAGGEYPLYLFTVTCEALHVEPPLGADEQSNVIPYDLWRVSDSPQGQCGQQQSTRAPTDTFDNRLAVAGV